MQVGAILAELLWPLFPVQEILESNGTYDQDDAPLDWEAQLGGFVGCAIEYLEDAHELLHGRRPATIGERLAEARAE